MDRQRQLLQKSGCINPTFGQKVFELLYVSWFTPQVEAQRVHGGCYYNVYLLHGLAGTSKDITSSLSNCSTLFVEVLQPGKLVGATPTYRELYRRKYMTAWDCSHLKQENRIENTLVANINLLEIDPEVELTIRVRCEHKDMYQKKGLLFEGMVLVPDPNNDKEFEKIKNEVEGLA